MQISDLPPEFQKERAKSYKLCPDFDAKEALIQAKADEIGEALGSDDIFETLKGWLEDMTDEVVLEKVALHQSDKAYLSALYKALIFEARVRVTVDAALTKIPNAVEAAVCLPTITSYGKSLMLEALRTYLNTSAALARRFAAPSYPVWRELILLLHEEHLIKQEGAYDSEKMKTFVETLAKAKKDLYVDCCIVLQERKTWGGEE